MPAEARPLVFLGSPEAAAHVLSSLVEAGFVVDHVVTRPDARRGRGGRTSPTAVKRVALEHGIEVVHDLSRLRTGSPTGLLGVVVAYGRIIPADVLAHTAMINLHFSLLPRWRGAAPVERAIMAGDQETGVCVMELEETLDTGAVHRCARVPIGPDHDTVSLTRELAEVGANLLIETLRDGLGEPVPQHGEVTYADKIGSNEGLIDWSSPAVEIDRRIRALRAHTVLDGARLRILGAKVVPNDHDLAPGECDQGAIVGAGNDALSLTLVQPEGRQVMEASAWRRGRAGRTLLFSRD